MQRKFQVFISSTYTDLIEERQDALKSVLDLGHIPSGMEGFYSADEEQLSYIQKIIDECDYYILIIAGKYGSTDEIGKSYTEREYEYALSKGITVLAFIRNDLGSLPASKVDTDTIKLENLESFRKSVSQRRMVSFWSNREQLKSSIIISLSKSTRENPGIGWVRGDTAASEQILSEINNLRNQLDVLFAENSNLKSQLLPNIADIASIDSIFTIRYSYFKDQHRRNSGIEVTWRNIAITVLPSYYSPFGVLKLERKIKALINENKGSLLHLSVFSSDLDTIKIQLLAYGLLEVYSATASTGGVHEYLKISELGKRTLIESGTVKSTPANPEFP